MANQLIDCGSGVRLERRVACRMSDGCTLYSDHYYPPESDAQAQPTLLMRQPYGRDIASTVVYAHPVWFARHGYNVVIQDVRGRGDSEGEFYPFRYERRDGVETIQWLLARPECNGKLGMYGFSYQGATQLLAAAEQPAGLLCIAPAMAACNLYEGWFYHQGALRLASSIGWGLQMLRFDARRLGLREAHDKLEAAWTSVRTQPLFAPYAKLPAFQSPGLPTYVNDWLEHSEADEFWSSLDVSTLLDRIAIPALHVSGWYDPYLQGSYDGFLALANRAATTFARDHQYLIAGPWQHIPWGSRIGESDFGPDATLDTDALLLRWFNHWLKDSDEFSAEPRIRHFALGHAASTEDRWFSSSKVTADEFKILYLASNGRANSSKGDGLLTSAPPSAPQPPDHFVYDPEVPVLAPGGGTAMSGPFDQAMLEQGNNLLVYTSAPLIGMLHIFGAPELNLFCATSAASADFTGKLVRVTPEGRAEFICIGIARSTYVFRESGYTAHKVHQWRFTLEPTSCIFAVGDRLRLEIAGSAFPLYDRNPSSDIAPRLGDPWTWQRSTHTLHHDLSHSSYLRLPLFI
jgi:putative CocE/NonD family hydrolase